MDWLRWYHGTISDPKWRVVARKAGQCVTVRDVLSVWAAMLEHASQANPRGRLTGWDNETAGAALDLDADQVASVYSAMQGRTLEGDMILNWEKRQPKREDSGAAERKRKQREREGDAPPSRTVTQGHAGVTQCHDRAEQSRADETRTEQKPERDWFDVMAQCCAAAGLGEGRAVNEVGLIGRWSGLGLSPEAIVDAIKAKAKTPGYQKPRGMAWFNPMLDDLVKARKVAAPVTGKTDDEWREMLSFWLSKDAHKQLWGKDPFPGEPGCKVPAHIIAEFRDRLIQHGFLVSEGTP